MTPQTSAETGRLRVGLVSVYFGLFDEQMGAGFRESRDRVAREYADALASTFDVVYPGLVASDADGRRVGAELRGGRLDAVVFAPSMAAPPSYAMFALEGVDRPIVVWNAPTIEKFADDLTQAEATVNSSQVGAVMLANVLVRRGIPFTALTAVPHVPEDLARVIRTVKAACAASAIRHARVLRVGDPIAGYWDVEASADDLRRLGTSESIVSVEELNTAFNDAATSHADELLSSLTDRGWSFRPHENAVRSARLALALSSLTDDHRASCGTVNCHGPWLRWNPQIGISACLGVSLLSERGRPFSCTSDLPAALALKAARTLAPAALYGEFYAPERSTGLMLLAAGGEGDPAWASQAGDVVVEANEHYPGQHGAGSGISFGLRTGPATVLSLSPGEHGWRLAWATGDIVESRYPRMGGPNAMFRFDSGPSDDAGARWIASGATHHNAVAPGRLELEIPVFTEALEIDSVRI